MYSAVVLAGGVGSRMHQAVPKQFLALAGKPMILHTLERLDHMDEIDEIIIVCHSNYKELLNMHIAAYMLKKPYVIVDGGVTRQESAYNGVKAAKNQYVMLHEAARPFVTTKEFQALLAEDAENVTYGLDIPFTVLLREGEAISGILERNQLVNIQLPQKFNRELLLSAYEKAEAEGKHFTEDASLLYHYTNCPVKIIDGRPTNIKITSSVDLMTGEAIYKEYIVGRN